MKKYLMWIVEAFIWLLIIITIIMGSFFYNHKKLKQKHNYHVFFKDSDGLKKGSPVKIMGSEIGYVTHVKVVNNDEIFVSFVLSKPYTTIPTGSLATIESTGLVGSRSLEIYPPTTQKTDNLELVIPYTPERVSGAFSNSNRVSDIIYKASTNVNKTIAVEDIPFFRNLIHDKMTEITTYTQKIDEINDIQNDALNQIKNNQSLKRFNAKLEELAK